MKKSIFLALAAALSLFGASSCAISWSSARSQPPADSPKDVLAATAVPASPEQVPTAPAAPAEASPTASDALSAEAAQPTEAAQPAEAALPADKEPVAGPASADAAGTSQTAESAESTEAAQTAEAAQAAAKVLEAELADFEQSKDASDELRFSAMKAEAGELAAERFAKAEETRAEASVKYEEKDYVAAAEGYRKAGELYELSEKKATANKLRQEIFSNGYAKYSESFFQMGEEQYEREEVIWAYQGPIEEGKKSLDRANEYYGFVAKAGAEYKSFEGKDKAQAAREAALAEKADLNASESFASAEDIMAEALANQGKGSYESAYLWFMDASGAYGAALDESLERKGEAEAAIERAEAAVGESAKKAEAVDLGDNVYLEEAKASLGTAKAQYKALDYLSVPNSALRAGESALRSDTLVAEKIEAEKARAEAGPRLEWAKSTNLASDHPAEFARAQAAMKASDAAFLSRRFSASANLAEEASALLSDSFREKVRAEREASLWGKAQLSEFASAAPAGAMVAQSAQARARERIQWAEAKGIKEDYPEQYAAASASMLSSYIAYGGEDYGTAIFKAYEVDSILSDSFMAKVEQEREAAASKAARLAAEKAAAEAAMADARTRMAWAENNEIGADYPSIYAEARSAMAGAELSYPNERPVPTRNLAESVSALLSDDFMAKVLRERRLAEEAAAKKAADRAAAETALAEAERRMAWANENGISADFPIEFGTGSSLMGSSLTAFGRESYAASYEGARRVSEIFSDAFMARVEAERRAAKETAARLAAEELAAREAEARRAAERLVEKVRAEAALADAERRMAWANANGIAVEYQAEYSTGSRAMGSSLTSFGREEFEASSAKAREVSEVFSDEFMARVESDRRAKIAAAEKAAAEKAAADKLAAEKAAAERAAAERAAAERLAAEKAAKAAADKAAADKLAAEKAAAERAAAERAAAEKLAAEKAAFAALPAPSFKLSLKPQYFSPDGDGQDDTLIVSIESSAPAGFSDWKFEIFETAVVESAKAGTTAPGRLFASWSGKGAPPASISWNGRSSRGETVESATDYSYRMTATDSRGKSGSAGGTFTVDVLVIRDGDKLKINVPSIVFRANFADFIGLSTDVVDKNEQVVSRIAQILNRFPGYSIEIQGHANSISKISGLSQAKIDAEEKNELIPLSKGRAEYVKAMLIRFGVDATRLSAVGLGSSKPVVKFSDAENRWKNRRVEFVLIKKK